MIVLGLSAFYHDSAAALIRDGEILAAAQEERFSRIKSDSGFPGNAAAFCLRESGIRLEDVDWVGFYDKPILTFDRLLETYLGFAPQGFESFAQAIPVWVKNKLLQKSQIQRGLNSLGLGNVQEDRLLFGYHHHSHAAAAFYPSPFDKAAILVMDGVGEWATTTFGIGDEAGVRLTKEIRFPHSLGLLYSALTYYLGFEVNEGEYKVMGLAPYGEPAYVDLIRDKLIDIKSDGSFRLRLAPFGFCTGLTMTNPAFDKIMGRPRRKSSEPLEQFHMDVARSIQVVLEEIVLALCRALHRETGMSNLCLAGGVALNCVANGRILREGPFEDLWIQPAAGDAGSSIGIAYAISDAMGSKPRKSGTGRDAMSGTYLGPAFSRDEIVDVLQRNGAIYEELDDDQLFPTVARHISENSVVGWFQGRMEFGPRALGNRSIIGDARSPDLQKNLNLKIKYRESFRPFAPAVLREDAPDFFALETESPYMLLVAQVKDERLTELDTDARSLNGFAKLDVARSDIPAVTHVDNSARVQTVDLNTNPRFYKLLTQFKQLTGYGVLINTSFNVRDEPIVCSPLDAYRCFMATEMDVLVIENFLLRKELQ